MDGVTPTAWRHVLEQTRDLAPSPRLQFSPYRLLRMLHLLRESGEIESGSEPFTAEVLASLQFQLGWDWTLIAVAPELSQSFSDRALVDPKDFQSLFELPFDSYYLALGGSAAAGQWPCDGLLVTRDHCAGEGLYLGLVPVRLEAASDPTEAVPAMWLPQASSWDEAAALQAARSLALLKGTMPEHELAAHLAPTRRAIAAWEPLVALVHAVLVGADGKGHAWTAQGLPRADTGVATRYVEASACGSLRFGDSHLAAAPRQDLRRPYRGWAAN